MPKKTTLKWTKPNEKDTSTFEVYRAKYRKNQKLYWLNRDRVTPVTPVVVVAVSPPTHKKDEYSYIVTTPTTDRLHLYECSLYPRSKGGLSALLRCSYEHKENTKLQVVRRLDQEFANAIFSVKNCEENYDGVANAVVKELKKY